MEAERLSLSREIDCLAQDVAEARGNCALLHKVCPDCGTVQTFIGKGLYACHSCALAAEHVRVAEARKQRDIAEAALASERSRREKAEARVARLLVALEPFVHMATTGEEFRMSDLKRALAIHDEDPKP